MPVGKPIHEWKSILIDTGIILALFKVQNGSTDSTLVFIDKLISFLNKQGTGKKENRVFYISTITLGEILTKESGSDKIRRIVRALDSENVEFLSFDLPTSLEFNIKLQPYLSGEALHKKAEELGFKTQDYAMARQWISKDYMIAMSGIVKKVDVILTADKKTFYPICKEFPESECILTYPELFEQGDISILRYYYDQVDDFLKK